MSMGEEFVGDFGSSLGIIVGSNVGLDVKGCRVGRKDGCFDGLRVVGCTVGSNVLGNDVGQTLRTLDGRLDGLTIGRLVGQI